MGRLKYSIEDVIKITFLSETASSSLYNIMVRLSITRLHPLHKEHMTWTDQSENPASQKQWQMMQTGTVLQENRDDSGAAEEGFRSSEMKS